MRIVLFESGTGGHRPAYLRRFGEAFGPRVLFPASRLAFNSRTGCPTAFGSRFSRPGRVVARTRDLVLDRWGRRRDAGDVWSLEEGAAGIWGARPGITARWFGLVGHLRRQPAIGSTVEADEPDALQEAILGFTTSEARTASYEPALEQLAARHSAHAFATALREYFGLASPAVLESAR